MAKNRESSVHKVLGLERIDQVCDQYGLDDGDREAVHQILTKWEELFDDPFGKARVAIEIVGNNPKHSQIVMAMMEIIQEFAVIKASNFKR